MSEICIRAMRASDFDAVRVLFSDLHALHSENRPDIYKAVEEALLPEEFGEMLAVPGLSLVAEVEGTVAGFCVLSIREQPDTPKLFPRRVAFIEAICVDAAHRRQGIGEGLYREVVSRAKAEGAQSIGLKVRSFNDVALRFYERVGLSIARFEMEERL